MSLCTTSSVATYAIIWCVPLTQPYGITKNEMSMCVNYNHYSQLLQVRKKLGDLVSEADHQIWKKWMIL